MKNWRCFFGFHSFPRWSDPEQRVVGVDYEWSGKQNFYQLMIQYRTCDVCGKYEWRKV